MTLIISLAARFFALQAIDRRIVLDKGNGKYELLKERANKTVVFATNSGIFCLSYTGLASLDNKPMDQWIVEQLIGTRISSWGLIAPLPKTFFKQNHGWHLRRLCQVLTQRDRTNRRFQQYPIEIAVVGFVLKWRRLIPTIIEIKRGKDGYQMHSANRYWFAPDFKKFICSVTPEGNISAEAWANCRASIIAGGGAYADPAESILAQTMSAASRENKTVGPNTLSVAIAHPLDRDGIRIRFFSEKVHWEKFSEKSEAEPAVYRPWMILQRALFYPSIMNRKRQDWTFGKLKVTFENMTKSESIPETGISKWSNQPPE